MEIERIKYPSKEFYKYGEEDGAVRVDDKRIEEWINDSIQSVKTQLENGVESPYSFVASGDSIVICFYSMDVDENTFDDENYFSVIVARGYEQGDFFIGDIKKDKKQQVTYLDNDMTLSDFIDSLGEDKVIRVGKHTIRIESDDDGRF